MYKILCDHIGGNIRVISLSEDTAYIDTDLRDTEIDWFYWNFRVEGAEGKTIKFKFPSKVRVGYYGAAVSQDGKSWRWQYEDGGHNGGEFSYTFGAEESCVYFSHHMFYSDELFFKFAEERALQIKVFCRSGKERAVPCLDIGRGEDIILLTARHHSCESTGSYVLEGLIDRFLDKESGIDLERYRIICVPMVDIDGVIDGDQGKSRMPHDHNKDYGAEPAIYSSTAAIRKIGESAKVKFAIDLHSPYHLGQHNDAVFIPIKTPSAIERIGRFSSYFEEESMGGGFPYYAKNNILPNDSWNIAGAPTFAVFMDKFGAELAFTLETPYFSASGVPFSPLSAYETGKSFARALIRYIKYQ